MAPSRRASNGRSPLVNPQRQITSFFSVNPSTSSSSPSSVLRASSSRPVEDCTPSPSPPQLPKIKKPPLVVTPPSDIRHSPLPPPETPHSGSFSQATDGATTEKRDAYGGDIVGKRIRVFWPLDEAWYEGCVKSFDKTSGRHVVVYDDGDDEILDLANEKVELLNDAVRRFRRLRKNLDAPQLKPEPPVEVESLEDDISDGKVDGGSAREDCMVDEKETAVGVESEAVDLVDDDEEFTVIEFGKRKRINCVEEGTFIAKKSKSDGNALRNSTIVLSVDHALLSNNAPVMEVAEKFGSREAEKFEFLGRNRKDANGRHSGHPNYDPKTLYLPPSFLKNLTGGQRQWWDFKSKHMDKVLFFKMGKFYELFEMDAHIGAKELDLQYMKGEQPHCGFPEKNFSVNAEKLARKGYRVLVVEQTETPEQLELRRKEMGTKDRVVRREICAVVTKGTLTEGEMLSTNPDAFYMISLNEESHSSDNLEKSMVIGVCVAEISTGRFILGQFEDDVDRHCLCTILSELRPVEIVKPKNMLSPETEKALFNYTRNPLVNELVPGLEFWNAEKAVEEVGKIYKHYGDSDSLPEFLLELVNAAHKSKLALAAFGGCLFYLREALLDKTLLRYAKYEALPHSASCDTMHKGHMLLDSAALENLEIFENNRNGSLAGTLYAQLDNCVTAFGKRLLRYWLARPLYHMESIIERQEAIALMKDLPSVSEFRKELSRLPDMERLVSGLFAICEASGRNSNKVVLYEDSAKKQLLQFISALRGCQSMARACSLLNASVSTKSSLLQTLLTACQIPEVKIVLSQFEGAFDWSEAELLGCIVPREGVDPEYDLVCKSLIQIEKSLEQHLEEQRKILRNASINYVTVGKDSYLLELPESLQKNLPQEYELRSSKKGFFRYWTPKIKKKLADYSLAELEKESRKKDILKRLVSNFCGHHDKWRQLVASTAELDVLIGLSVAGNNYDGPTCRPIIKDASDAKEALPFLSAKNLGHPVLKSDNLGNGFVPNDLILGGSEYASFLLLSGPNMGGKSTLLRQVCLSVILAQLGAEVPASSFEFSPVDRIFVRMGARDHIMTGQSTFLVELSETAAMLSLATQNSLVALDELGRGTSTSDGQAIAQSVLEHFVRKVKCRGIFSTHYHRLAIDYENDPQVALSHMACKVGEGKGGVEEVTFLYRLTPRACPKSYGVNVARLAGFPDSVLVRAASKSTDFEAQFGTRKMAEDEIAAVKDVIRLTDPEKGRGNSAPLGVASLSDLRRKIRTILQG